VRPAQRNPIETDRFSESCAGYYSGSRTAPLWHASPSCQSRLGTILPRHFHVLSTCCASGFSVQGQRESLARIEHEQSPGLPVRTRSGSSCRRRQRLQPSRPPRPFPRELTGCGSAEPARRGRHRSKSSRATANGDRSDNPGAHDFMTPKDSAWLTPAGSSPPDIRLRCGGRAGERLHPQRPSRTGPGGQPSGTPGQHRGCEVGGSARGAAGKAAGCPGLTACLGGVAKITRTAEIAAVCFDFLVLAAAPPRFR
jgi:hypothetical protein